jgi:hypothetical protein
METGGSTTTRLWARRAFVLALGLGAAALGAALALHVAWLRADEVPPVLADVASRTPYEPLATATDEDFAALQEGLAAASTVAPELFPRGIEAIDAALYDSTTLYVYAHDPRGGTARGVWNGLSIQETPLWARPTRRSMKACHASEGYANWTRVRAVTGTDTFFMCPPVSTFVALQRGATIYDTRESYLATVVHEVAHQYLALHPDAPPAAALAGKLDRFPPPPDRGQVLDEAWATWAELRASRRLYPAHFERLRTDFLATTCRDRPDEAHCLGLRLALEVLADEAPDAGG